MERITLSVADQIQDKFYIAYLTREQFNNIPSLEGIRLYEEITTEKACDYMALYYKGLFINTHMDEDEDDSCYIVTDYMEAEPEFYIRSVDLHDQEEEVW